MTEQEARNKIESVGKSYLGTAQYSKNHSELVSLFNSVKPDGYTLKAADPWCAGGISAFAIQAFGKSVAKKYFPLSASVPKMVDKAKSLGIWVEKDGYVPKESDWIIYDWNDSGKGDNTGSPDHVGLVTSVKNSVIKVLECNYSTKQNVAYREIKVNGRYIRGFVTPNYAAVATALTKNTSAPTPTAPKKKSNAEIAKEVLAGKWGNGDARKKKLEAAGYNYQAIQNEVNKLASGGVQKYKTRYAMNVRSGNSTKSKVLRVISKGTIVEANQTKGNWIYSNKYAGWICIKDSTETYLKKVN